MTEHRQSGFQKYVDVTLIDDKAIKRKAKIKKDSIDMFYRGDEYTRVVVGVLIFEIEEDTDYLKKEIL